MMRKSRWVTIVFAGVILALVLVSFLYRDTFFPGEKTVTKEQPALVSEGPQSRGEGIKKKIEPLPSPTPETPRLSDAKKVEQDILQERAEKLFGYLDRQEYIQAYHLKEGSYRHFLGIASKLSSLPPVVSGETDDLILLKRNMAHFFRVVGKKDISLVLDILSHEEKELERAMEVLFEWGVREAERENGVIDADMADLYEYAAFFLNTVAGKAYLLRRDSRVRILLTYYSILILDRADTQQLNRHGLDILPHVNNLIDDINRYNGLDHKDKYLERLNAIRERTGRHLSPKTRG